jgi:protein arginine N-methyltransferase 2
MVQSHKLKPSESHEQSRPSLTSFYMDDPAFQTPSLDLNVQTILLHASNHDLEALKPLLRIPGNATVQDPETGFTPLHAAIAACGSAPQSATPASSLETRETPADLEGENEESDNVDMQRAKDVVKELFLSGAIWNDLDVAGETPGCLAWRLGRRDLYGLVVEAGVRAEMLLGLLGGYQELESGGEEEEGEAAGDAEEVVIRNGDERTPNGRVSVKETKGEAKPKIDVNSEDYLRSTLQFEEGKLLDEDMNGVMMAWETNIMRRSVDLLLPDNKPGTRILNVGFGMGIIDRMFRSTSPLSHHIIEAHPAVLSKIREDGSDFGSAWERSAPEGGKYIVHSGRWQEVLPKLLEAGEVFDCIYFDTFGEDYSQLKLFFSEFVIVLLSPHGKFGFFNGLGADRRVCYDVYSRVVELDLCEAGMDVEFTDVPVDVEGLELDKDGEGAWKGVRRRYFAVDGYRLPVCTFMK